MDIAIVTGASSSLGLAISRRLIQLGFRVYGLGGDYKECSLQNVNFRPVPCDLSDTAALEAACNRILEKEKGIYLLVNNAKYFGQNSFEKMSLAELERIMKINLVCPLVLMRMFGESLCSLQGYVIQLGAPFAESSNGGAPGAASAGGLKWMGEQLFAEYRQTGLKVCHISPEPNRAKDARMRVRRGAKPEASIDPEAIAQAIEQILQSPFGNVVTEMIIRPLRIDEPEQDPVWKIPYPEPQPIPYTVPREIIEAEEQLEEEEWKKQQQLKRKRRSRNKAAKKQVDTNEPKDESAKEESNEAEVEKAPKTKQSSEKKPRRRSRRKPKPPNVVVGFHDSDAAKKKSEEKSDLKKSDSKKPKKTEQKPVKEPVESKKQKKPVKKVVKKTEKKETKQATKQVVNKSAKKAVKKAAKKVARKAPAKPEKQTKEKLKKEEPKKVVKKTAAKKAAKKAVKKAAKQAVKKTAKKRPAKKAAKPAGKKEKPE